MSLQADAGGLAESQAYDLRGLTIGESLSLQFMWLNPASCVGAGPLAASTAATLVIQP